MNKPLIINIFDKAVFFFTILFAATLTNSIFLNQLGYYGALVLLIARYAVSRENPFSKSGLEIAFIFFIAAELISSVLSDNQGRAFFYMAKRVLLLPITYMIIASASDDKKAKSYFYIYLAAALVSVLVYLFFSYRHLILNLYNIQQSGPSIFQYPITASEIMSFTVIILFAFLINEKMKLKFRLLTFIGFALSAAALFSTYKRTGWIGAAFGILIILILKKQWKILTSGFFAVILIIFIQENISLSGIYTVENELNKQSEFSTDGRAYNIHAEGDEFYLSDFNNGIITYKDNRVISQFSTPAPAVKLYPWKDNYFAAYLLDTRFLLLEKRNKDFVEKGQFITPGFTTSAMSFNGNFYVMDSDSGLTLFTDPANLNSTISFKDVKGTRFYIDKNYSIAAVPDSILVFSVKNNLPDQFLYSQKITGSYNLEFYDNGKGILSGTNGSLLVSVSDDNVSILDSINIPGIYLSEIYKDEIFLCDTRMNLYRLQYPLEDKFRILKQHKLHIQPSSMSISDGKLYYTYVKENRILSIFDQYNPSNFTRLALWRAGWKMFLDNPFFGVGDIDLQQQYIKYKRPWDKEIQGHLHNNFMHVLATLGIFGFFAVCYLMYKILIINIRIYNYFKEVPFRSSFALGVTGAFCSVLAAGLTEVNIWDHEILTLVLFTTGLNIAFYQITKKKLQQV